MFCRNLLSVLLAFQVFLSSLSFTIDTHWCGDTLKSIGLFNQATPCKHNQSNHSGAACHHGLAKKLGLIDDCCHNKKIVVEGLNFDAEHPNQDVVLTTSNVVALSMPLLQKINFPQPTYITRCSALPPLIPPRVKNNLLVKYQVFLI